MYFFCLLFVLFGGGFECVEFGFVFGDEFFFEGELDL